MTKEQITNKQRMLDLRSDEIDDRVDILTDELININNVIEDEDTASYYNYFKGVN